MKIVCIGGGPAGLYFALLMKQLDPRHDITVVERNKPYDTFGWGVVFSDATMDNMREWDPPTAADDPAGLQPLGRHRAASSRAAAIRSGGHGFVGIGRKKLLNILQARCEALGVKLRVRDRGRLRRRLPRRRPDHRQRRHQLEHPQQVRARLQARHRDAAQPLHLAGHAPSSTTPSPSSSRRPSTAGSRPTSTSSTTRPPPSSSRRPSTSGRRMAWTRPTRTSRSPSARSCSPTTCRATS